MAIRGSLIFDDDNSTEYSVLECEYDFVQNTDVDGRPDDGIMGGKIIVTIVTPPDGLTFYEWMFHDFLQRDGLIMLQVNAENNGSYHYVMFKQAWCVGLYEYFNNNNSVMMMTRITIQANKIIIGDAMGQGVGIDLDLKKLVDGSYLNAYHYGKQTIDITTY